MVDPVDAGEPLLPAVLEEVRDQELDPSAPEVGARGFPRSPVERLSITSTSSPRATSASTRCDPMNPAPPVTTLNIVSL